MKNLIKIISCLTSLVIINSCSDFLSMTPRDVKVISTIEDYRDIMGGFVMQMKDTQKRKYVNMLGVSSSTHPYFGTSLIMSLYSNEIILDKGNTTYFDSNAGEFTTAGLQLQTWENTSETAKIWLQNYGFIGPINLVIDGITRAKGTDEELRNYVKGEALVWRAYTFYKLLQYFSPYKNNELGIPIHLESVENIGTAMPSRKTQAESFAQILKDCNNALSLLEKTPTNQWNFWYREDFIYAMMASVYTWKAGSGAAENSDWQNAYDYAKKAQGIKVLTNDPAILKKAFNMSEKGVEEAFINYDEITTRIVEFNDYSFFKNFGAVYNNDGSYNPFADKSAMIIMANQYDDTDIRKGFYFKNDGTSLTKYQAVGKRGGTIIPFRLAEMVLIQAEAKSRMGEDAQALQILNDFRAARYTTPPTEPTNILEAILEERELEFFCELDFRWLDMKRQGIEIERTISGKIYNLKSDDFRYTFPVPAAEMEANSNMIQAPGWENILVN